MKPPAFEYRAPDTLEEALELLAEHGDEAKLLAGGQSLMPLLAMRLARPSLLVDLNGIASLAGIEDRGDTVAFGTTTRERRAERSALVARRVPVLAQALPLIGHLSIRNRGTVGGSLAHADASAELPAVALLTEATMVVRSRAGERHLRAEDFFVSHFTTALAADECLVEVRIPANVEGTGWAFEEVARRQGDFALVGAAAMVILEAERTVAEARLCLFGVSDRPVRPRTVEVALAGQALTPEAVTAAADQVTRQLEPASDLHGSAEYRRHLARVTLARALTGAARRAEGDQ